MKIEIVHDYKLEKGDECTIWFYNSDGSKGYALCEYKGRNRNKEYIFESVIYGWKYYVNLEKKIVTWKYEHWNEQKEYVLDESTGWTKDLP